MGLTVTLFLTTRSAENSYRLGELQDANRALEHQAQSLRREVESARSAPVLARAATELGMVPAGTVARLVVGEDNTVTVVGEPTPAAGPPQPTLVPANGNGEVRLRLTPPAGGSAAVRTPSGAVADEALVADVNETIPTAPADPAAPAPDAVPADPAAAVPVTPESNGGESPLTPTDAAATSPDPVAPDPALVDATPADPTANALADPTSTESPLTAADAPAGGEQ